MNHFNLFRYDFKHCICTHNLEFAFLHIIGGGVVQVVSFLIYLGFKHCICTDNLEFGLLHIITGN